MRSAVTAVVCAALTAVLVGASQSQGEDKDAKKKREELEKTLAALEEGFGKDEDVIARKKGNEKLVAFLKTAESMEVFRLDHSALDKADKGKKESFHGYAILARTSVEKAEQRAEVAASLGKALHWFDYFKALCFRPRHGLRAVQGKRSVDLVICFECSRMKVYEGEELRGEIVVVDRGWEPAEKLLSAAGKKAKEPPKP